MLDYASQFLLGYLGGYHQPTAVGDGGAAGSAGFRRPWAIPLLTFGGALVSAFIVAKLAPEAEGHGTDSAIEAVHTDPRAISVKAVLVKMVSSALTIGSGGSGGSRGTDGPDLCRLRVAVDQAAGSLRRGRPCRRRAGYRFGHRRDLRRTAGRCGAGGLDRLPRGLRLSLSGPGVHHLGHRLCVYGSFLGFEPLFGRDRPQLHV